MKASTELESLTPATKLINHVAPDGIWAKVFLAFLTTAGIFYINIMPAVVSGLKDGLGFSNQVAGFVSSANLYGASVGALLAVLIVGKIQWRKWSYLLLFTIIAIDLLSTLVTDATMMIGLRGIHGIVGGLLVGIGFAIISRTADADKTFGYLLFIQWGLGGLGLMILPGLAPEYGVSILFYSLVLFSVVTLCMLPFLPDYPVLKQSRIEAAVGKVEKRPLIFTLVAIFLFQAANMGLFAFMIGLGENVGLATDFMSSALGMASWIALLGAFLVMMIGTKFGRTIPLVLAITATAVCSYALHFSAVSMVYFVMNLIIGITWAFALPYMFGMCSEFDRAGQYTALGGFASKMGLASGPMLAGLFLGSDQYNVVINLAVIGLILCCAVLIMPARLLDRV